MLICLNDHCTRKASIHLSCDATGAPSADWWYSGFSFCSVECLRQYVAPPSSAKDLERELWVEQP
jgi:hypothetical protein